MTEKNIFEKCFAIYYSCNSEQELLEIVNKCLLNKFSFEYLNEIELHFYIHSKSQYLNMQKVLGEKIINLENL